MIIGVENIIKMLSNATILDEEQLSEKEIDDIKKSMKIILDSIEPNGFELTEKAFKKIGLEHYTTIMGMFLETREDIPPEMLARLIVLVSLSKVINNQETTIESLNTALNSNE